MRGERIVYPTELTEPMRKELTQIGVTELRTPDDVDQVVREPGTTLVFVNSVCGCAAGMARPGLALSLKHGSLPDRLTTVFAGVDKEATARARSYFAEWPPTSPQIALLKDGKPVQVIQRHQIEGTSAEDVAAKLVTVYNEHCSQAG
jgi:putative YphP/YqiW family bacilliredoxin